MRNWHALLQAARIRDHLIAAAVSLLLWLPVGIYVAHSHRAQSETLAAEAASRTDLHVALLAAALERAAATIHLLPTALRAGGPEDIQQALGRLSSAGGVGSAYEVALAASNFSPIRFQPGEANAPRIDLAPLPPDTALVPLGDPLWTVRPSELMVTQSLFMAEKSGRPRFWGYASTTLPFPALVAAARLSQLVDDGYGVYLRHAGDSTVMPVPLIDARRSSSPLTISRYLPLSRAGQLQLDIEAPPALSPLMAALGWLSSLLVLLPIYGMCLRLRIRSSGQDAALASQLRAKDEERDTLALEVSNRIRAERLLERSHLMLDAMFEHLPGMVVIKRASDLRITRVNRFGEDILGRNRDFVLGRNSDELYGTELATVLTRTDYQAMAERRVIELPLQQVSMPGQPERWVHFRKVALFDRHGDPEYVLEFGEDETARELLDRRLREHLNFLEQLIEAIPAPLFFKDTKGQYISVNSAFERFIGKSRTDLEGKTAFDFSSTKQAFSYHQADKDLLEAGGNQIYESTVLGGDGVRHDVMFHKAVFRATSGKAEGVVGIIVDISERKQAELRIGQLNRILTILSETNQAIVRIHDRDQLLHIICRLIQEKGGFSIACVHLDTANGGYALYTDQTHQDDLVKRVCDYLNVSQSPLQPEAISVLSSDYFGEHLGQELLRRELPTVVNLRLSHRGHVLGGISILGSELDRLSTEEQRMLTDLADNVSFALEALAEAEARRTVEEKLELSARVFDNSTEGIIITDAENRILMVNKAFTLLTGYEPDQVIGRNPSLLSSGRQSREFYSQLWESLQRDGEWRGEIENRRRNGQIYPEWLNISLVRNEGGEVSNYVAVFSDLTNRKEIEARLDFLAYYDPLTSLPNRTRLAERLQQALIRPLRKSMALLVLDIDRFKLINDSMGQQCGDRILLSVAERLNAAAPDAACVCRLGGDEFAILLDDLDGPEDAASLARTIQRALRSSTIIDGHDIHLSVSIGISLYPEDGSNFEELTGSADTAMYAAIGNGGNTYCFFRQDMNSHAAERIRMESRLHSALEKGEFEVYYQPLVASKNGRIVGAEALLRWFNADLGGFVSPAAFIPLLEETGLIVPVGEWVLRTACEENQRWRHSTGGNQFVAVNLSALQLADELLVNKISNILDELAFPAQHLEIELTESAVMRDPATGVRMLQQLKGLGVKLSVDDFGTGYSSLSYLRRLPLDTLKIDRSFITETPGHAESVSIVRAIVALGHSLQLSIIAEGVEETEQVAFLRESAADILQGFHFSRPIPAAQFRRMVEELERFPMPPVAPPPLQLAVGSCQPANLTGRIKN